MERKFNYDIMPEIKERWSPRAFSNKVIPEEVLMALLEAARYAPSCNNEQPWRFVIANDEEKLARMRAVLDPGNQEWANRAPVLILVAAEKAFQKNGSDNCWSRFDAGTAWGYFSLEAQRRGLIAHAMGGFSVEKALEAFNIPDRYEIITVIAVGYYGNKDHLSEFNQNREHPNSRKEIEDLLL
jgi:nitroreductase